MDIQETGLKQQEVIERKKKFGLNEIPEKNNKFIRKIVKQIVSPITLMLLAAALLSLYSNKIFDFTFIIILMMLNIAITLWQENKADNAVKELNKEIISYVEVIRDGKWDKIDSKELVPDDIVELNIGDVVPADAKVLKESNLSINESTLTGESLPVDKKVDDKLFSGSFLTTGQCTIKVTETGLNTYLAQSVKKVNEITKKSILEKDILNIAKYLTIISLVSVVLLNLYFLIKEKPLVELLTLDLSIVIAGIPISLTTVMTLIIEFGAINLYKKKVIVRRLSALEELSNVDLLLTDKTGTLTKNEINIYDLKTYNDFSNIDILQLSFISASKDADNPINRAIIHNFRSSALKELKAEVVNFIPADSERKHSSLIIKADKYQITVAIGAPQIIKNLIKKESYEKTNFDKDVEEFAEKGYRALAVAIGENVKDESELKMAGVMALSDTLREDAADVLKFLGENQIKTVMVTGDNVLIAKEISRQLGMEGNVLKKSELEENMKLEKKDYEGTSAFAEVLPDDKYKLVKNAEQYYVVSANGDGVNDIPAILASNVGIAVASAVSSLKSAADIVLLSDGIAVIKDAIIESRKIFARLSAYAQYRISESFRLILTILLLGILVGDYPLTPLQIILLALLNDIPIISLAFDRVRAVNKPSHLHLKKRFAMSSIWGLVGVVNSMGLFILAKYLFNLDWAIVQTMFFLKLTVSGHLLIYIARTKERWYKYLPSKIVIFATLGTQLFASLLAFTGFLMPGRINIDLIIFVWVWSFFWMQIGEVAKIKFYRE